MTSDHLVPSNSDSHNLPSKSFHTASIRIVILYRIAQVQLKSDYSHGDSLELSLSVETTLFTTLLCI